MSLLINTVKKLNCREYAKLQRKAKRKIKRFKSEDDELVRSYWKWVSGFCDRQMDRYRT